MKAKVEVKVGDVVCCTWCKCQEQYDSEQSCITIIRRGKHPGREWSAPRHIWQQTQGPAGYFGWCNLKPRGMRVLPDSEALIYLL